MAEKEQVANTEATKETNEKVEVNEPKENTFTQSQVNKSKSDDAFSAFL